MEGNTALTGASGRLAAGESEAPTKSQSPGATKRQPEAPLPTIDEIAASWDLGRLLTEALAAMAEAAPIATEPWAAYLQARALKRAWRALMRAQIEAKCGVLPGSFVGATDSAARRRPAAPLDAEDAATVLGFTFGLTNALRAICHAARSTTRDDAVAQIAEAMAALKSAIEVREAIAYPIQNADDASGGRLPAGQSPGATEKAP